MGSSAPQTSTVTQSLPKEMKPFYFGEKGILPEARALYEKGLDLPDYEVAGLTGAQNAAAGLGMSGIGSYLPLLAAASGATGQGIASTQNALGLTSGALANAQPYQTGAAATGFGSTQAYNPYSYQSYMNPYMEEVVRRAEADIGRQGEMQAQQLRSNAVASGAFGGSRQAVAERELGRDVLGQQAKTASDLRAAGYSQAQQQAQQAFEQQQARQANFAQLLGGLGTSYGQLGLQGAGAMGNLAAGLGSLGGQLANLGQLGQSLNVQDINTLMGIGSMQQMQSQAELDAARQNQLQAVQAPYQALQQYAGIVQGVPTMPIGTQVTTTPGPNAASQIAGLAMGLGSMAQGGMFGGGTT